MVTTCPKCGHVRNENDDPAIPDYECPACGIVYEKYQAASDDVKIRAIKELAANQLKEKRLAEESAKRRDKLLNAGLYIIAALVGLAVGLRVLGIAGTVLVAILGIYLWAKKIASARPKKRRVQLGADDEQDYYDDENYDEVLDKDNWEGAFWEIENPYDVNVKLQIEYIDGKGNHTSRNVDVRQFGKTEFGALLMGHCHMRNATRTFRTDRIKHCVDIETGEVVSNVTDYLIGRYQESPQHSLDVLMESELDVLRIILFVAKADGRFMAAEKKVACMLCRKLTKDDRLTVEMIDGLFKRVKIPTLHGFKLAVGRLAKQSENRRMLYYKAAEAIVGTQKTVHPSERDALEYMRKRFALQSKAKNA